MKNYDFINNELWFSRRAIQCLTQLSRNSLQYHINYLYTNPWCELPAESYDKIRILNKEGSRFVRRPLEIFNLEATCAILNSFVSFPNAFKVTSRCMLLKRMAVYAREKSGEVKERRRIITDAVNNELVQHYEDKIRA